MPRWIVHVSANDELLAVAELEAPSLCMALLDVHNAITNGTLPHGNNLVIEQGDPEG